MNLDFVIIYDFYDLIVVVCSIVIFVVRLVFLKGRPDEVLPKEHFVCEFQIFQGISDKHLVV